MNKETGNVTELPYFVKAEIRRKTHMTPQNTFLLEADSCSAVKDILIFYGRIAFMAHKIEPLDRNLNQLN